VVSAIWVAPVAGQGFSAPAHAADSAAQPACSGQIVSRIDIVTRPPFEPGGPRFVARVARVVTELHATTRHKVVARYLALHVGEPCTEFRRLESERILRAQPFIADATVLAAPDGRGGVAITVVTVDEISLVGGVGVAGKSPVVRSLRLGDRNIGGEALSLAGAWRHGFGGFRDIYRGRLVDYQFLGRPYQFSLQGSRNEIGGSWDFETSHPFLTDLQRVSWRVTAGNYSGYAYFVRPGAPPVELGVRRSYRDIGGVRAFGPPRRVILLGATLSRENERTAATPVIIAREAVTPDTTSALINRYGEHQATRANLLVGFRNIRFMRVAAFDAVEGAQDVRDGFQVATLIGRGLTITPADRPDWFTSADVYAGTGTPHSFAAIEALGERRQNFATGQWDGLLASSRAAWYAHPAARHTTMVDAQFSGGWRARMPFQLTLANRNGGLQGYRRFVAGGGERLVMRLEDRVQFGHLRQFAGVGGVAFLHAGKLWAGDVPFGVTTGVEFSAGVGVLAALPPSSRRLWRLDVAVPLNRRQARGIQIVVTNHDFTRWFWREPPDVQGARERSIPNSVYNWP